jgi:hypothetical protein
MIDPLDAWNPFDALIGRDSDIWQRPDLSFLESVEKVPVAGLCVVHRQNEYGKRQRHAETAQFLRRLGQRAQLALIELDTELSISSNPLTYTPSHFESLCARLDVMLTTRLHGMVIALKNGVPVIAIDPILNGGKLTQQAEAIGWEEVYSIETVRDDLLDAAMAHCLTLAAREAASRCAASARAALASFTEDFENALRTPPEGKPSFTGKKKPKYANKSKLSRRLGRLRKRLRKTSYQMYRAMLDG